LPLHNAMVVVLAIYFVEAAAWTIVYIAANDAGQPLCCPYPVQVIVAGVFEVIDQLIT
jgi:hypothetical protein